MDEDSSPVASMRAITISREYGSGGGWSKPWPAGTNIRHRLCGMASAAAVANALACADWLAQEQPFGFATQLLVLVGQPAIGLQRGRKSERRERGKEKPRGASKRWEEQ